MESLWRDEEAARFSDELDARVYSARLLGSRSDLTLHGGGNCSVKLDRLDRFGDQEKILFIKGSGWDLATIDRAGFAPLKLEGARRLAALSELSDSDMVDGMRSNLTDHRAPTPSVEALLHALIEAKYVDHAHPSKFLSLTNSDDGSAKLKELYGDKIVYLPYVMPGFKLVRAFASVLREESLDGKIGIALERHGLVSFGSSAKESYERMIELVDLAEKFIARNARVQSAGARRAERALPAGFDRVAFARLRRDISKLASRPMIISSTRSARIFDFIDRADLDSIASRGPATPDHVLRAKRVPLIGRDLESYARSYEAYFNRNRSRAEEKLEQIDPAPRIILDKEFGLVSIGSSAKVSFIARDIYSETIEIIEEAESIGSYQALGEGDIFDVEYWELERAKLLGGARGGRFEGESVFLTGGASGIGAAMVDEFIRAGAAVSAIDLDERIVDRIDSQAYNGLRADIRDGAAVQRALDDHMARFGSLDILIVNAGLFGAPAPIAEFDAKSWREVFAVNFEANLGLLKSAKPLLALAARYGRALFVGSRNVTAPGLGASAYSVSKSALTQLARLAALEWAADRIRVNVIHPDGVFDTSLWSDDLIARRAAAYGISADQYKRRNLLGVKITSRDVARAGAALVSSDFRCVTGAQIPIDGGNDRVI